VSFFLLLLNTQPMKMKLSTLTLLAAAAAAAAAPPPHPGPIIPIHTFGTNVFVENLAVRSNGRLLVTSMSVPHLYQIDPSLPSAAAEIIHTFANITGITGIVETFVRDKFALITGTFDLAATRAIPGTLALWTVDLNRNPPEISLVAHIPDSPILNGLAAHPTNPNILLGADSALGAIWRIDLTTGTHGIAISSPEYFTPTGTVPGTNLGINGIRTSLSRGGNFVEVYFTNSARGLFGKVAIDPLGNQLGDVKILSHASDVGVIYDDFALDINRGGQGEVWIASHPSQAVRVTISSGSGSGQQFVVNDTALLKNPTSAAFGRGSKKQERTLYITNGGEFSGNDLINGGVVAIEV